jgi:hypothetical protein
MADSVMSAIRQLIQIGVHIPKQQIFISSDIRVTAMIGRIVPQQKDHHWQTIFTCGHQETSEVT